MTTATNIFEAGETVEIEGIERDCECSNCGRPLKVGVKLAGYGGFFGADCISRAVGGVEVYMGRKVKLAADTIKDRAFRAAKGDRWVPSLTLTSPLKYV